MATPMTSHHRFSNLNSRPCYDAVIFSRPHLLPTPSPSSLTAHAGPFDGLFDEIRSLAANATQRRGDHPPPSAEDDGSSFVALDPNSTGSVDGSEETTFGPLAMLAVGLLLPEYAALQSLLLEMGAAEVQLIPCTAAMLEGGGTLGEALQTQPPHDGSVDYVSSSGAKVVFLSGMYASEVIEVVGAVRQCEGLADLAFAAAVPNSWGRELRELVEDVSADHATMAARRAAVAGQTAED